MSPTHLLTVTADRTLRVEILASLDLQSTVLSSADNPEAAATILRSASPDLVVVDARGEIEPVLALLKEPELHREAVVLVVTDGVGGNLRRLLLAGADDGVTAGNIPELAELAAARLTQRAPKRSVSLQLVPLDLGRLQLDFGAQRAFLDGVDLGLSGKELHLLYAIAEQCGTVVTRETLLTKVWAGAMTEDSKTLDVHVSRLRKKLDAVAPGASSLICCLRRAGYLLSTDVTQALAEAVA